MMVFGENGAPNRLMIQAITFTGKLTNYPGPHHLVENLSHYSPCFIHRSENNKQLMLELKIKARVYILKHCSRL
jgi:hypothetical protein